MGRKRFAGEVVVNTNKECLAVLVYYYLEEEAVINWSTKEFHHVYLLLLF